ncbi:MAG: enoyl-CoA hydratase/isomerase family protein, partial [Phycisphaerae bacterium]|nr:enoyl-CoA hydratase/isomerase family protein [Phycisphaerae bacterium]
MNHLTRLTSNGPIGTLTLNRPEARNALSIDLLGSLHDRADEIARRDDLRVLILTGEGKSFCAGMDLDELRATLGPDSDKVWADAAKLSALYELIYTLSKPTIAAVNGA